MPFSDPVFMESDHLSMGDVDSPVILPAHTFPVLIFLVCLAYVYYHHRFSGLPPGPVGLPFFGNLLEMPKLMNRPWITFSQWSNMYGGIIYLNIFGRPAIVVNSTKVARDLLDKRSRLYSNRPILEMNSLVGWDRPLVLQHYGSEWRAQRRFIVQGLAPSECLQYHQFQEREMRLLIRNVARNPESLISELTLRVGAIIMRVTYGYSVKTIDDPMFSNGLQTMRDGNRVSARPEMFAVHLFSWLQHIPPWIPGTGFLVKAKQWKKTLDDATWMPIEFCNRNLYTGKMSMPNLCGNVYHKAGGELCAKVEGQLALAATAVFAGGIDASISLILTFLMFMILRPEIQKKAQVELDQLIGNERLPSMGDMHNLPYIRSIMTEVYRFAPPIPLAVAHTTTKDDVYEGMFIPKGALVFPNVWHMLRDADIFPNPTEFIPERYNGHDSEMQKVKSIVFGFGRRVCPGKYFAEGTVFSLIATVIATCPVLPGLDGDGNVKLPDPDAYTHNVVSCPEPFPIRLRFRHPQVASLLSKVRDTNA